MRLRKNASGLGGSVAAQSCSTSRVVVLIDGLGHKLVQAISALLEARMRS